MTESKENFFWRVGVIFLHGQHTIQRKKEKKIEEKRAKSISSL